MVISLFDFMVTTIVTIAYTRALKVIWGHGGETAHDNPLKFFYQNLGGKITNL